MSHFYASNSSYPSRASELNPSFCGVHGAWSLVFCVVFCRSLFLGCFFPIALFVLWFTDSDYPFVIFKLYLPLQNIWAQPVICGVHGALSLVFCVVFCRSLLLVFFCRLYCLSFDDLRILITLLVSSNSSCPYRASELNPSLRRVYGAWSLVFCALFVHCIVFPSTYGFWLPLWYLQTLLALTEHLSSTPVFVGFMVLDR
jgi:hypothetical protein